MRFLRAYKLCTNKSTRWFLTPFCLKKHENRPAKGPLGAVGAHAYYQITPDNPGDFPDYNPTFYLDASKSNGLLKSRIDAPQDTIWGDSLSVKIDTPGGDTNAIQALLDSAQKIDAANVDYDLAPDLFRGPGENSNSFATTILKDAGLSLPEGTEYKDLDPKWKIAAGLGRAFDIDSYKKKFEDDQVVRSKNAPTSNSQNNRPSRPSGGAWGWNPEIGWWRVKGT